MIVLCEDTKSSLSVGGTLGENDVNFAPILRRRLGGVVLIYLHDKQANDLNI
jgi:hypothetical protein